MATLLDSFSSLKPFRKSRNTLHHISAHKGVRLILCLLGCGLAATVFLGLSPSSKHHERLPYSSSSQEPPLRRFQGVEERQPAARLADHRLLVATHSRLFWYNYKTGAAKLLHNSEGVHYGVWPGDRHHGKPTVWVVIRPHNWHPTSSKEYAVELLSDTGQELRRVQLQSRFTHDAARVGNKVFICNTEMGQVLEYAMPNMTLVRSLDLFSGHDHVNTVAPVSEKELWVMLHNLGPSDVLKLDVSVDPAKITTRWKGVGIKAHGLVMWRGRFVALDSDNAAVITLDHNGNVDVVWKAEQGEADKQLFLKGLAVVDDVAFFGMSFGVIRKLRNSPKLQCSLGAVDLLAKKLLWKTQLPSNGLLNVLATPHLGQDATYRAHYLSKSGLHDDSSTILDPPPALTWEDNDRSHEDTPATTFKQSTRSERGKARVGEAKSSDVLQEHKHVQEKHTLFGTDLDKPLEEQVVMSINAGGQSQQKREGNVQSDDGQTGRLGVSDGTDSLIGKRHGKLDHVQHKQSMARDMTTGGKGGRHDSSKLVVDDRGRNREQMLSGETQQQAGDDKGNVETEGTATQVNGADSSSELYAAVIGDAQDSSWYLEGKDMLERAMKWAYTESGWPPNVGDQWASGVPRLDNSIKGGSESWNAGLELPLMTVDVGDIQARLQQLGDLIWDPEDQGVHNAVVQGRDGNLNKFKPGVEGIVLIFSDQSTQHVFQYPYYEKFKDLLDPLLHKILGDDALNIVRLQFARMKPGVEIKLHHDMGLYAKIGHRIHIPIHLNPGVKFDVCPLVDKMAAEAGHRQAMSEYAKKHGACVSIVQGEGLVFELNNRVIHKVINQGTADRVQLIVDVAETRRKRKRLKPGAVCEYVKTVVVCGDDALYPEEAEDVEPAS